MSLLNWLRFRKRAKRINLDQALCSLVDEAAVFGLPARDVANVKASLEYAEHECALDTLVQQLCEHGVPITEHYYQRLKEVAETISLPAEQFSFVKELIR